jgi:hypothetical protein
MKGVSLYPDADPVGFAVLGYAIGLVEQAKLHSEQMAGPHEVSHPWRRDRNPNNPGQRPKPGPAKPNDPSRAEGLLDWLTP